MTLINAWVLFGLIPLYYIYKKHSAQQNSRQIHLLYLALFFMFLAMARPALKDSLNSEKFNSQDFIIALDASYSMMANDIKPNRYEAAKKLIKNLVQKHPKDRFTIFVFTSNALLISPPTTDNEISIMALDALNPKFILTKSTNLKNLFLQVAKLPMKQKNLIIFSDGGDEHDVSDIAKIAKKNSIIPYIVATGTQRGAALKKNGKYIKNTNDSIVISKINPILPDLANATHGKYYQLKSLHNINTLSNEITNQQSKKTDIQVQSYKELFYIPLILAIVLYFFSITKLGQKFLLIAPLLLLFPNKIPADVLDFYHIKKAKQAYSVKNYKEAATQFHALYASPQSYFNLASTYYKLGKYKAAAKIFSEIRTREKALKQKIYYDLGNCALKLKKYNKAKKYYIDALAFGEDGDALHNLNLLYKLHLTTKEDITKILPKNVNHSKKQNSKENSETKNKKNNSAGSKSSSQSASSQAKGGGSNKKGKKKETVSQTLKKQKGIYKFTYKAYEKINKGYTDEKEPW